MTKDAMVATLRSMFDTDAATAASWVQERYDELIDESGWSRNPTLSLGPTVSGTSVYALPATVDRVNTILVGGAEYQPVGEQIVEDLASGSSYLTTLPRGVGGVFTSSGDSAIRLYPVPSTSGSAITARVSLEGTDIADGTEPAIPRGLHTYLLEGAMALGFQRVDERGDLAAEHEQKFQQGVDKLRRRTKSRVGHGPWRIRVV